MSLPDPALQDSTSPAAKRIDLVAILDGLARHYRRLSIRRRRFGTYLDRPLSGRISISIQPAGQLLEPKLFILVRLDLHFVGQVKS